ncbi:hypothetical protein B0H11DRAFT_2235678 [Mycena galericulata]|nr:hypothetical protein B0H11DRAFT_2235678 [Mycena galericulata]
MSSSIPLSTPTSSRSARRSPLGSSPTLQGDNTPGRFLSPLRLDSVTASPFASTLGKRTAGHLDDQLNSDEDEEDEQRRHEDAEDWCRRKEETLRAHRAGTGLKIRLPCLVPVAGGAGGGGGDGGGGGGGGNPINLWTPDCARRGDPAHTGSASDIGNMPCNQPGCHACEYGGGQQEEETGASGRGEGAWTQQRGQGAMGRGKNNRQAGQRKRARKEKVEWRLDPDGGPAITEGAGLLLSKLLAIFGRAHRKDLEDILVGEQGDCARIDSHDMVSVVARITQQTNDIRVRELHLMLSLIQLALNVDNLKADAKLKHLPRVTGKYLAQTYAPGVHENTFADWVNHGKKLMLLCAGGRCP